jgi:tRNA-dihydrouridine synthase B
MLMAAAARESASRGAYAIDINMGCPAKKVLRKAAGSALLKDTRLVSRILRQVVSSVEIPVTLKIRTGWCRASRNGTEVARIAEDCGIALLSVHGRTRECRFKGAAEYETIAAIKQAVTIPVIANGDIDSPEKAAQVLTQTQADGLMIGRAAQGRPWIFREIQHFLDTGAALAPPSPHSKLKIICAHLCKLHDFYGDVKGVWYSRKHVARYVKGEVGCREFLMQFNAAATPAAQLNQCREYFDYLAGNTGVLAA